MNHFFIPILAQTDLPSVPAEVLKWVLIVIVAIALIAAVLYAAWKSGQRPVETRLEDDPPIAVRKVPKRYNHDATEQRFTRIEGQIGAHDAELDELWKTMREEDTAIRERNAERFEKISLSLGRIEGRLGTRPPNAGGII